MVQVLLLIVVLFIICQSFKIIPDLYEVYACTVGKHLCTVCRIFVSVSGVLHREFLYPV
jgi:hypothetical protein